jgi:hypothetical protein
VPSDPVGEVRNELGPLRQILAPHGMIMKRLRNAGKPRKRPQVSGCGLWEAPVTYLLPSRRQQSVVSSPLRLLEFHREDWERKGDGRFDPLHRWKDARAKWLAKHPNSLALGDALQRFKTEFRAQFSPEHYPPAAASIEGPDVIDGHFA